MHVISGLKKRCLRTSHCLRGGYGGGAFSVGCQKADCEEDARGISDQESRQERGRVSEIAIASAKRKFLLALK